MGWIKCSKEAFEKCSYKGKCGRFDDAFFLDESECDKFNQSIKSCIVDAVPVVRCRDCKFWMPAHIERDDGSIMPYEQLPRMEPGMAPIEFGVNVGSYCTLCENVVTHGFRDGNPCLDCTRLWRREDDYCSRGQRRGQSADVRNMGQFAGGGKKGGPNDADQH
mgnify:CR=1 FL=1|nr:MAG TPA: hypothetical protein [Caudoviricetes sp.]